MRIHNTCYLFSPWSLTYGLLKWHITHVQVCNWIHLGTCWLGWPFRVYSRCFRMGPSPSFYTHERQLQWSLGPDWPPFLSSSHLFGFLRGSEFRSPHSRRNHTQYTFPYLVMRHADTPRCIPGPECFRTRSCQTELNCSALAIHMAWKRVCLDGWKH